MSDYIPILQSPPQNRNPLAISKINYIINFVMDWCDAPLTVWLRCLFPALIEAFLTYYAFDPVQIFTGWVRPHGALRPIRGAGHRPRGKPRGKPRTWLKKLGKITGYDPWDDIGRRLPFGDGLALRDVPPGVIVLWNVYDIIERYQYWIMVYEIVEQGLYRTMSGVAESEYCREQYRPSALTRNELDYNIPVAERTPILIGEILKERHMSYVGGNLLAPMGFGSSAYLSAKMLTTGGLPPVPQGQRVVLVHQSGLVVPGSEFAGPGSTSVAAGTYNGPGGWWAYCEGPGIYAMENIEFNCLGMQNYIEIA